MSISSYLLIPFLVWVVAQGIKFSLSLIRGEFDLRYLFASGGMPSVHSAVVCGLATTAFIEGGANSPQFGVTAVYAGIVMYDSFGVRRSAGEQAHALNTLLEELTERGSITDRARYGKLREILGHKPVEVIAGAVLGVCMSVLFEYQKIQTHVRFIFDTPRGAEIMIVATVAAVLSLIGAAAALRYRKAKAARERLIQRLGLLTFVAGILLGFTALSQYERISYFSARGIGMLVVLSWGIWVATLVYRNYALLSKPVKQDESSVRKDKWLVKAKRRSAKKKK